MFIFSKKFTKMIASTVNTYSKTDSSINKRMVQLYDFYEGSRTVNCVPEKCMLYKLILEKRFRNDKTNLRKFAEKDIIKIYLTGNPYGLCCESLSGVKAPRNVIKKYRILKVIRNDCSFTHCDILNEINFKASNFEH